VVDNVDLSYPIGIGSEMYYKTGEDEEGNVILDQVGSVVFPEPGNKAVYEVWYYGDYEGPRDNENEASKQERALYLDQKKREDEAKPEVVQEEKAPETTEEAPATEAGDDAGGTSE
jgi:hypothetical protein